MSQKDMKEFYRYTMIIHTQDYVLSLFSIFWSTFVKICRNFILDIIRNGKICKKFEVKRQNQHIVKLLPSK